MARRTKEEAAITREQLLDAAENVFRRRGIARSSLAEVAAAAGVTRGAVYWHFRDKADLCAAMCERAMLPMEIMLSDAATATHDDPLGALRMLAVTVLTRLARDPRSQAVFEVMQHEGDFTGEMAPLTQRKQRERQHCLTHVESVLQQAVASGQLPPDTDTAFAALALHAYIGGIMQSWVLDPAAHDLGTSATVLVDIFLTGLRASPPRIVAAARKPVRSKTARDGDQPSLPKA